MVWHNPDMGADSGGLIALVGTIAGVVGAIAAILQVLQNNASTINYRPKGIYHYETKDTNLFGLNGHENGKDIAALLAESLWVVFILLIAWLVIAIFNIHHNSILIYLIMVPPALLAAFLFVRGLYFSWNSLSCSEGPDLTSAIWATATWVIDILVVVTTIKII